MRFVFYTLLFLIPVGFLASFYFTNQNILERDTITAGRIVADKLFNRTTTYYAERNTLEGFCGDEVVATYRRALGIEYSEVIGNTYRGTREQLHEGVSIPEADIERGCNSGADGWVFWFPLEVDQDGDGSFRNDYWCIDSQGATGSDTLTVRRTNLNTGMAELTCASLEDSNQLP